MTSPPSACCLARLADLGYYANEAEDGAAGLKIFNSTVRIGLLVTDVGLPGGFDGRQIADAARAVRPDLKLLFITGYAESAVLSHGHLDPGMHVMTKPFAMDALATRIRELIVSGRAATARAASSWSIGLHSRDASPSSRKPTDGKTLVRGWAKAGTLASRPGR